MTYRTPCRSLRAALLVLVLLVGLALAPAATGAADGAEVGPRYRFTFGWASEETPLDPVTGTGEEGAPAWVSLPVGAGNVSSVEAVLTWADRVGDPDRLALTLRGQGNATSWGPVNQTAHDGRVAVPAAVAAVPSGTLHYEAGSEADAWRALLAENPGTPSAPWGATVLVEWAGDELVAGVPIRNDTGNDWRLEAKVVTYRAVLVSVEELPPPEDPDPCPDDADPVGCEEPEPGDDNETDDDDPGSGVGLRSREGLVAMALKIAAIAAAAALGIGAAVILVRRKKT